MQRRVLTCNSIFYNVAVTHHALAWHGNTLIFRRNWDGFTAQLRMEYHPGTCCVATVKTLGRSCRAVDCSNAHEPPKSMFANHCKCFSLCGRCRAVLGIVATPNQQTTQLCNMYVVPNHRIGRQGNSTHCLGMFIALPYHRVTCCCIILEKRLLLSSICPLTRRYRTMCICMYIVRYLLVSGQNTILH